MFKSIFAKTFYERRWTLLAWSIGLFAMALLTMIFYPYFKNAGFEDVINNAPKSIQGLLGDAAAYKTIPGYIDQQIFALRMPMLTLIFGISLFVGIGVGDENRGTLETLLAQPVSRAKVYWHKFLAGAALTFVGSLAITLGVWLSLPIVNGSISIVRLLEATFACWLLTLVFGAFTYSLGAMTGKRGLTIGVASAVAFLSYLITSLAPAVEKLSSAQRASVFYYYNNPPVAVHGLNRNNLVILTALIVLFTIVGALVFHNRDLSRE